MAAAYISQIFKQYGLQSKGTSGYEQTFQIPEGRQVNASTHMFINGEPLTVNKDFFPLHFSSNNSLEAFPSLGLQEMNMPWFLDVKTLMAENAANPHYDVMAGIRAKALEAQKKGATAFFVYNSSEEKDNISFEGKAKDEALTIP